jgi:MFS family permease
MMHIKFGQRGVAIVGPACHLISYIVFSLHPPYPVLVVMFIFVGFGNGLIDAAWCAWIGNMANSNEVSGFLQACYALGATVAPLIATAMISKGGLGWYAFYYIMVSPPPSSITQITSNIPRLEPRRSNSPHPLGRFGNKPDLCIKWKTPKIPTQRRGEREKP